MAREISGHGHSSTTRLAFVLAAWAASSGSVVSTEAAVIYVNAAATGANDGSSWTDAFADLQNALAAAQPTDEIWVAAGTYTPGRPDDAVSSFVLRSGVALYGGFAGDETTLPQRDWDAHPTILSGDVGHDDVYSGGAWYQGWNINTANSGHVVDGGGVDATAVLDGFTVTAGSTGPVGTPAGHPLMYGSGLYVVAGSPTVRHCTFTRNVAAFAAGGAIYCRDGAPSITHCRFVQNRVHLGNGGGIAVAGNAVPTISDCEFSENRVTCESGSTGQGAGLSIGFLDAPLEVVVARCTFSSNVAVTFYAVGGYEIARGGGISNFGATLTVRDCVFHHNSANAGAGVQTWDSATIVNCLFHDNIVYSHDYSGGGGDGGYGAGICLYSFQPDVAAVVNCTVVNNAGGEGVGMQSLASAEFLVRNTIIWGNVANGQDVAARDAGIRGNYSAWYSCIQDLLTPVPDDDPPDPTNYPGCIIVHPQFMSATDFRLADASPCIDAGRNADVPAGVTTDLAGAPRFYDDPAAPDVGQGPPPVVDMGAYEHAPLPCAGDMNCDGSVNFADIDPFVLALPGPAAYLTIHPGCLWLNADCDGDNDVDFADIDPFVARLGASCP